MSAGGSGAEGDVDLNIAPIVDCFTVLIAYLLVSMSFISLGIFEAGVAATGPAVEAQAEETPPLIPLSFSVDLSIENKLELKLTGGEERLNQVVTLDALPTGPDLETLKSKIGEMKDAHPLLKEANISAGSSVRYKSIIKIIEAVKTKLPKVFLASS